MSLKGIKKSDGTAEYIYADDTLSEENAPGEAKAAGDRIAGVEGRITTLETAAPEIISNATKDWLDDNVTPTGSAVAIDSSLTQSGLAADAKAAGDAVNDLKSDLRSELAAIENISNTQIVGTINGWVKGGGTIGEQTEKLEITTPQMSVVPGDKFIVTFTYDSATSWMCVGFWSNGTFARTILSSNNTTGNFTITVPNGAETIVFSYATVGLTTLDIHRVVKIINVVGALDGSFADDGVQW